MKLSYVKNLKLAAVSTAYLSSMVLANFSIAQFGLSSIAVNSFVFIGLDLSLRDYLQYKLPVKGMGLLIILAGGLTWILHPSAGPIAIASAVSFLLAALLDWLVFSNLTGSWKVKSLKSNLAGAVLDSLLFPLIAFGLLNPSIVLQQVLAKVVGGAFWTWLISKFWTSK